MDDWVRIPDDEFAKFGKHVCHFTFQRGTYSITVDQSEQDLLTVEYQGETEFWQITRIDKMGDVFILSGGADWIPELMDQPLWYQLYLDGNYKIEFWGDRILIRTDHSLS